MEAIGSERSLRIGLAGLGRFGKLHASALSGIPGVELSAICDPVESEVELVGAAYNVAGRFGSYPEMLEQSEVDAVFIVTPEHLHEEMVGRALDASLPAFVEKPLATSAARARELADAALEAGIYLQVGFVLRFESLHATLKAEIDSGAFGRIVTVRAKRNCTRSWFDAYGDRAHSVHETIIHDIDLLLWLLQARCERVYAAQRFLSGRRFPDAVVALLQFANASIATLETSWLVPDRAPANVLTETWYGTIDAELEVIGEFRSARLRLLESGLEIWADDVTRRPEVGLWPVIDGKVLGALRVEDGHFVETVRTGAPSRITSVKDAVHGLEIAEAIIESAEQGREVPLPSG